MPKSQMSRHKPNSTSFIMDKLNLHKSKLYAIIIAIVGVIAHFLPWWSVSLGGFGGYGSFGSYTINGLHSLGILSFIAFLGAAAVPFLLGDKTKPFEGQNKMIEAACFGGAAVAAVLTLLFNMHYLSFGIFIAIAVGAIGALFVWGMVKMPEGKQPPAA
jgi:hypothetical protein